MPKQIIDENSMPMPVLTPDSLSNAAVGAGSATTALPSGAQVVEIASTTDCYILFGTSGTTVASTTGQFFPKGVAIYGVPIGATHLAHIQESASGRISITKLI